MLQGVRRSVVRRSVVEAFRADAVRLTRPWSGRDHGRLLVLGVSPGWPGATHAGAEVDRTVADPLVALIERVGADFDTVLTVLWLAGQPQPAAPAVAVLARLLRPAGCLLMIEPVRRPGRWARGVDWVDRRVAPDLAPPLGAPAPALLRRAGFTVAAVERMSMPRRHGLAPTLARIEARSAPLTPVLATPVRASHVGVGRPS